MNPKKVRFVLFLLLSSVALSAPAQKVKYKDLIELLNNNQFDIAEAPLRRYLKENNDNPSAFLYMALILQNKANATDMLREGDKAAAMMDSALVFFKKAYDGITEKELRKEDYYQRFRSRDVRTGEFAIKYTEVRFRLEQDMKNLTTRRENLQSLSARFAAFQRSYLDARARFLQLAADNPSEKELNLRADERTEDLLRLIKDRFDSAMFYFEDYLAVTRLLGKTGYRHVLDKKEIRNYQEDGRREFSFFNDDLKVWDFGGWAEKSARFIKEEVYPMREKFLQTDRELNNLRRKIEKDSVSLQTELEALAPALQINPVARFDADPMPLKVFQMTHAELMYHSKWMENREVKKSPDLVQRRRAYRSELPLTRRLDSLSGVLLALDMDAEAANYQYYVKTAYGSTDVLKALIAATHDFARRETARTQLAVASLDRSLNWLVAGADSIPLFMPVPVGRPVQPMAVVEESHTHGLKYPARGAPQGYFYTITPARVPDLQVSFRLDSAFADSRKVSLFKGLSATDGKGQLYFAMIFSEERTPAGLVPVTLAKIYRTDGLAWQMNYKLPGVPTELQFNAATGELLVRVVVNNEPRVLIMDKAGKLLP
jgi:hypothetical protein